MLLAGLAAFLVPAHHPGPYGIPPRGLLGGVLAAAIAAVLLTPVLGSLPAGAARLGRAVALAASPLVLFFCLYSAFAELEEVVVLHAEDAALRLWIVDHEGNEWVSMPRWKAEDNALDGARLELLRRGETRCVVPHIVDDPAANRRTFDLRQAKYAVQRLAVAVGLFGDGPGPDTVTLRLDPCP
jgi:hypothetical protein